MQQPSQVWERCEFERITDWVASAPFRQCAQTFQARLRGYLFGSGTPESPPGKHLEELTDAAIPVTVLRASALLAAVTDCEDLPADPDYKIHVRRFTCASYFDSRTIV